MCILHKTYKIKIFDQLFSYFAFASSQCKRVCVNEIGTAATFMLLKQNGRLLAGQTSHWARNKFKFFVKLNSEPY